MFRASTKNAAHTHTARRHFVDHPAEHQALQTRRPFPPTLLDALKARFAERVSTSQAVREHHGRDESPFDPQLPDAVVFARSTEEVQAIVRMCAQHGVPIIPYGNGSSLEGHLLAVQGGVSIDLSEMKEVISINAEDLTVTVQPGISRKQLNEALKDTGPLLPDRSRRGCEHRRHVHDARLRHQCRALRLDARKRPRADGRARRRPHHQDRHARASRRRATTSRACSSARKARSASSPKSPSN